MEFPTITPNDEAALALFLLRFKRNDGYFNKRLDDLKEGAIRLEKEIVICTEKTKEMIRASNEFLEKSASLRKERAEKKMVPSSRDFIVMASNENELNSSKCQKVSDYIYLPCHILESCLKKIAELIKKAFKAITYSK